MAGAAPSVSALIDFATTILAAVGVPDDDAATCGARLLDADLRGQRAHGISRLPSYVARIEAGGMNPVCHPRLVQETAVSALIDGDNGLGPVVVQFAVDVAIAKAQTGGLAWIGIRRSNHAGAGGVWAQQLVDARLIGIFAAVANTNQMAPWGGTDKLLGPNPLSIGIPASSDTGLVLDMATSAASFGKVRSHIASGRPIPEGWLIDADGKPVTDPNHLESSSLAPIGGHKGYGLSLVVAALAGTLNGAAAGSEVVDHYQDAVTPTNTGQVIIAADPGMLRPFEDFAGEMDDRLNEIRLSAPMAGVEKVVIPGDGAIEHRRRAQTEGLALSEPVLGQIRDLGERHGVSVRFLDAATRGVPS